MVFVSNAVGVCNMPVERVALCPLQVPQPVRVADIASRREAERLARAQAPSSDDAVALWEAEKERHGVAAGRLHATECAGG